MTVLPILDCTIDIAAWNFETVFTLTNVYFTTDTLSSFQTSALTQCFKIFIVLDRRVFYKLIDPLHCRTACGRNPQRSKHKRFPWQLSLHVAVSSQTVGNIDNVSIMFVSLHSLVVSRTVAKQLDILKCF